MTSRMAVGIAAGGSASRMRRDRDNRYFFFAGAVKPENAVGCRRIVFRIGLKYFFAIRP